MIERVRAILITPTNTMLTIKRIRPRADPYWVLPGGHVDPDDESLEAALIREVREEVAGDAEILSLLHVIATDDERQLFYLARIQHWSFADRTGPEFSEDGRGEYLPEKVPLTTQGIGQIDLRPEEISSFLHTAISRRDLFVHGDLRQSDRAVILDAARAGVCNPNHPPRSPH